MDIAGLPKTELHLHLEGAIAHEILLDLVHKYGDGKIVPDLETLKTRLKYREFAQFVEAWLWKNNYLREYEDFRLIARSLSHELATKGIRYAEVSFSPGDFQRQGLHLQPLAKAIRAGLDDAWSDSNNGPQIKINLIVDLVRDCGPTLGARWLDETAEIACETGIVAIGLGGPELEFPPEPYAPVFRRAEALGFHRVAHAGDSNRQLRRARRRTQRRRSICADRSILRRRRRQYYKSNEQRVGAFPAPASLESFARYGVENFQTGRIYTTAALLAEGEADIERWYQQGFSAVDMETATAFAVAEYFGMDRAAVLYVFDNPRRREHILLTNVEKDAKRERGNQAARELAFALALEFDAKYRNKEAV
jgi:Adenosine deaminase/Phosphorylase superfamily